VSTCSPRAGRRASLPTLLEQRGRRHASPPAGLAVQGLRCSDLGHRGHGDARHAPAAALWFWAAYLVATHHPGISAKQLQRQLGIGRHETAWIMLHKLRRAMAAPEREPLKGEVEADEFFLGGLEEGLRGGRQRGKKTLVALRWRSVAAARGACASRCSTTPRANHSPGS